MTSIDEHYGHFSHLDTILDTIQQAYPEGPSPFQLAPIDQLHIGGIKASDKLLKRIDKASRILEIGSGLGGLSRLYYHNQHKAALYVCLDITHPLNRLNSAINHLTAPHSSSILTADGQSLPFDYDSFDYVVMQHSLLNIPDKKKALQEISRVLSPNGQLILHEVLRGSDYASMRFPVPWASQPDHSHLIEEEALLSLLKEQDFTIGSIEDWTQEALLWRTRQTEKANKVQKPALTPALVLGPDFSVMGSNVQKNLADNAIRIVEVIATPR